MRFTICIASSCVQFYILISFQLCLSSHSRSCNPCCYNNERPTGQKHTYINGTTAENKGETINWFYIIDTIQQFTVRLNDLLITSKQSLLILGTKCAIHSPILRIDKLFKN